MMEDLSPELLEKLFVGEIVYRPPTESNSIILEVALGCSYGRCTFCKEEAKRSFRLLSLAEIEEKLVVLKTIPQNENRSSMFFLGEDSFTLKPHSLMKLFELVKDHLPQVRQISMYARVQDVLIKTEAELSELQRAGLGDLYIGLESGSPKILKQTCKGQTPGDVIECCRRLDSLGISYAMSSIIGLGGVRDCYEHAVSTAQLYNQLHPKSIRLLTLTPEEGSTLAKQVKSGEFQLLPAGQTILEERLFLEHLAVENCLLIGNNVSNLAPLVAHWTRDKELILDSLDKIITSIDLNSLQYNSFKHT